MIMSVLNGKKAVLDALHKSFTWGSEWESREFTFVGRHIKQHDDWTLTVDQESYVKEVPITKLSLPLEAKLSDHPEMITEFRSGIGSLQWMAGTTRGDIAADTSLLQKPPNQLTIADLAEVNGVLRYVRATSDAYYKLIPIDFDDMLLIAYGDSAWANAPGGKSQGGLLVAATSKKVLQVPQRASLLEWKSYRHQRVLRSTLAAEAASLDKAEDYGNFIATMLSEMVDGRFSATLREVPLIEVVPVTDARSLWDAIHRLSTTFAEKRVEISIASLRQQCRALRWVPTEQQLADGLTKRSRALRDSFRRLLEAAGGYHLYCANCGDSRTVLCRNDAAVALSQDQKPNNPEERQRIEAAGGKVGLSGPCYRIDSGLNLSRALGDFLYKANRELPAEHQKVICLPEILEVQINSEDQFFVMASDGVFEVFSSDQLIEELLKA
eukprot:s1063_g1.t1